MKKIVAVLILLGSLGLTHGAPKKLAFERDNAVYIADLDGLNEKKIAEGQSPDFSPDGSKLAYNTVQADNQPAHHQLVILDLASGKTAILKEIPSGNSNEPRFSPDGTQLLFSFDGAHDKRHLAIVNVDGSGFRDLQKAEAQPVEYWSQTWAADGKSIFTQDMENLYQLDLNAKPVKKWNLEKTFAGGSMSSSVRLDPSPDGKTLLMDVEMNEEARPGWDGPPPALWTMDLTTEKVTRLTPKSLYAYDCHWLDAPHSILFVSLKLGEEDTNVYRMSTTSQGKDKALLAKNAINPATSR
jgi:TolB protein